MDFASIIKEGGAVAIAILGWSMFWLERQDRLGKDKDNKTLLERAIAAIEAQKRVTARLAYVLGQKPTDDDANDA